MEMKTFKTDDRSKWREYLKKHYKDDPEVWFVFPMKAAGEQSISYNDAVEEALCFGWIDSTNKKLDDTHNIRRFTPRKKNSLYSQPNIERLKWLDGQNMLMPEIRETVAELLTAPFEFPEDIISEIRKDEDVWKNYQAFSEPYKRIRIAYIEAARSRPEEFQKRLENFIKKTRSNKLIVGYGGVEKYYN